MHKPESVQESETHKILQSFEIQTDHLIPTKRPNLVLISKKKRTVTQTPVKAFKTDVKNSQRMR